MRSLLKFLLKNYAFLLFFLLEVLSLVLVFNYNNFQKSKFLNSSNYVSASLYNSINSVSQYFDLSRVNEELVAENASLRSKLYVENSIKIKNEIPDTSFGEQDSTFLFIPAKVINNSVNKQQNYLTLNRGRKHGIKPDQGILSTNGELVGVITSVSESFSTGLSLLNPRWSVSAKLKKSGFYGSLLWDGKTYQLVSLREIPIHVSLAVGDTVVSSGYSSIFPEGLIIGTIDSFQKPEGENYYQIKVKLSIDLKSIQHVEVIDNLKKEELVNLEKETADG